jgi:hypothetical protein
LLFSTGSTAKTPAKPGQGLHTGNRILIPTDDTQSRNFVIHRNLRNKGSVKAPLLWIDYVADESGKSRVMRLKTQNNLSNAGENPETTDSEE